MKCSGTDGSIIKKMIEKSMDEGFAFRIQLRKMHSLVVRDNVLKKFEFSYSPIDRQQTTLVTSSLCSM